MSEMGTWTSAVIAGKAADVYDPPGELRPRFGVLFLHGLGLKTIAADDVFTRLFAELRLACVCPHGQRSWWADRICTNFDPKITPERHLLDAVVPFFAERWGLRPRALGLAGNGMGGQGALRLAFKHPDTFPVVAALSSAIEYYERFNQGSPLDDMYDSKEQCRQDSVPMHVHPSRYPPHIFYCIDPTDAEWYRGCDRLHEKLNALGVPHECDLTTRGGGHSWEYYHHMAGRAVRFLNAGLEYESRRLL
jgi:pimeloyl-ACP methyl ester carboxylesterase